MKKLLFFFVAFVSMSAHVLADGLTATLQQGDKMTPFYGIDAFKQAYEAAKDGAVITLSSGVFNPVDTIAKSIKIYGAYGLDKSNTNVTLINSTFHITANQVHLEGICVDASVYLYNVSDCTLKRCYITYLMDVREHTNTLVDQCRVQQVSVHRRGLNFCIKNSEVDHFSGSNTTSNLAYITHCFIKNWATATSSTALNSYAQPYAIYTNNIIRVSTNSQTHDYSLYLEGPSEYYGNYFESYTTKSSSTGYGMKIYFRNGCQNSNNVLPSTSGASVYGEKSWTAYGYGEGSGYTLRGPYGGTGYSTLPAIPRITSKTIAASTNAEGKLNVKIAVKVVK